MKILIANKYFYRKGGSEQSMFKIASLFESKGHKVAFFSMHHPENIKSANNNNCFISNIDYNAKSPFYRQIQSAINIIYNREANLLFGKQIDEFKPDIIQSHNIYHQISPSIYRVAKKHQIPVFQFLHDYKVACPVYTLLSNGKVCNGQCRNNRYYWCALNKCNGNSFGKSLINTLEMYVHNVFPNYYGMVDLFVSPSQFLAQKVRSMGFRPHRIVTLPHFADTKDMQPIYAWKSNEIVYFGRLSKEKGLKTLITAVKGINVLLRIIGSGPLQEELLGYVKRGNIRNVQFIPHLPHNELLQYLSNCMFTILPSEWYENCPNAAIESFICGKPVIGAKIGGIPELVIDHKTGLTFEPGNADDLRKKIVQLSSDPEMIVSFGKNAREFVEKELNAEKYYNKFMQEIHSIL